MKPYLLIAAALLAGVMPVVAQESENKVSVDVQLRTRGEYRNGQGSMRDAGTTAASFIGERARLGISFERDNLSMKFSAQHTGVWGDDKQTNNGSKGNINVNEAWAKLKFGNEGHGFMQVGRQILSYDDERLLGGLDWATSGRSFDAFKIGYQDEQNAIHAILSYNQNAENHLDNLYDNTALYKTMEAVWYHNSSVKGLGISLLAMNIGVENQDEHKSRQMQTFGTYITATGQPLTGSFTAYYQTGKTVKNQSVSAYFLSLTAKYKLNPQWSVGVGDDYVSGSDGTGDKYKTFNVLYGTHHKFYGAMDYFNNSSMPTQGLNDLYANLAFTASKKVDLSLNYHYFALNHGVGVIRDNGKSNEKTLGSEFDLQLNWKVQKNVTVQCGYSVMAGTKAMQAVKGGNPNSWQDWGWISLNINPQIFKSVF